MIWKKSFITVVLLGLIAGFSFACRSEPSFGLNTQVVTGPEGIVIKNNDDFDWEYVEIKVNSKYEAGLAILEKEKPKLVRWEDLITSDGERFDLVRTKPRYVIISTKNHNGFYYGDF